jgi:drug/metabolite transporter (DMT)-like permease
VVAFLGVAVTVLRGLPEVGGDHVLFGSCLLLLSPTVSAISSVTIKRWGAGVHPISLAAVPMGICAGVMTVLAALFESDRPVTWGPAAAFPLAYLAIVGIVRHVHALLLLLRHVRRAGGAPLLRHTRHRGPHRRSCSWTSRSRRLAIGAALVIGGVALAAAADYCDRRPRTIERSRSPGTMRSASILTSPKKSGPRRAHASRACP